MDGPVIAAGVVDQHVQGTPGQKELVGGVIDLLAAEVPRVEPEGVPSAWAWGVCRSQ